MWCLAIFVTLEVSLICLWGGGNYLVLTLIRSFTIASVDVFVLISGYFMCMSNKRTLGKPLSLLIQVVVYSLIVYLIFVFCGFSDWSIKHLIGSIIPNNWFITLYIVLYFISPYLNIVISKLSIKDFKKLLIFVLLFFSIWPMILGVASSMGYDFWGMSTVGRGGNNAGYTIVNFITLYFVGAYLRITEMDKKVSIVRTMIVVLLCGFQLWGLRMLPINTQPSHIAGWYDNILVILLAASLLIAFKKMSINSNVINTLSKASFTVYIIHISFLPLLDTKSIISGPLYITIPTILIFIVTIYAIAFVLWWCFDLSSRRIQQHFDKIELMNYSNL